MPSLSICPDCRRELTLPDLANPLQPLRCPLCDCVFPAHQALGSSRSFPPAALLLQPDDIETLPADFAATQPSAESRELAEPQSDRALEDRFESHPDVESASPPPHAETALAAAEAALAADIDSAEMDPADQYPEPADESEAPKSGDESRSDYTIESVGRQKPSSVGVLGQLMGIVGGAIVGLTIGYYVLLWIGGPRADFLGIRDRLPRWLSPGRGSTSAVDMDQEPANELGWTSADENGLAVEIHRAPAASSWPPATSSMGTSESVETGHAARQNGADPVGPGPPAQGRAGLGGTTDQIHESDVRQGPWHPAYTADDLALVLSQAEDVLRCKHCSSSGDAGAVTSAGDQPTAELRVRPASVARRRCRHCGGKRYSKLTTEAYEKLCELALVATFVRFDQDDPARGQRRAAVEELLRQAVAGSSQTQAIGRLAASRLADSGRDQAGIVLTGTVCDLGQEGSFFRIRLVLFGVPELVTILSPRPPEPAWKPRDRVLILGSIVDQPKVALTGYFGNLSQVVWGGMPLKLDGMAMRSPR